MAFCSKCGTELPEGSAFCSACGTPIAAAAAPPSQAVNGLTTLTKDPAAQQYWLKRLVAYAIDAVIVYAAVGLLAAAAFLPAFLANQLLPGSAPVPTFAGGLFSLLGGFALILYFTFAEGFFGKTVGKGVMGLRVQTDDGRNPTVLGSFLRNLSKINWVLLLLDVIVGLALEAGYTKKFSDRLMGTKVMQA